MTENSQLTRPPRHSPRVEGAAREMITAVLETQLLDFSPRKGSLSASLRGVPGSPGGDAGPQAPLAPLATGRRGSPRPPPGTYRRGTGARRYDGRQLLTLRFLPFLLLGRSRRHRRQRGRRGHPIRFTHVGPGGWSARRRQRRRRPGCCWGWRCCRRGRERALGHRVQPPPPLRPRPRPRSRRARARMSRPAPAPAPARWASQPAAPASSSPLSPPPRPRLGSRVAGPGRWPLPPSPTPGAWRGGAAAGPPCCLPTVARTGEEGVGTRGSVLWGTRRSQQRSRGDRAFPNGFCGAGRARQPPLHGRP